MELSNKRAAYWHCGAREMSKYLVGLDARKAICEIRQCTLGGGGDRWPGPLGTSAARILARAKSEEGIDVIICVLVLVANSVLPFFVGREIKAMIIEVNSRQSADDDEG